MMASSHSQREPLQPQQFPGKSQAGASKRYPKIRGPKPARHIPWPEIFKHHISLVEGHLKMIEMVRKHTVEGSGNYNTMSDLVKRSKDMLYQAKTVARTFIPPPDLMEQVPLGSSSDSMYPGYSPANHEYGKAAEEFGRYASAAKQKGIDLKADGIDYKVGQSKGLGHMTLAQIRAANAGKGETASSASDVGTAAAAATAAPKTSKVSEKKGEGESNTAAEETPTAGDPMFFMDPNPTPLHLSTAANSSAKRKATPEPPVDANTSKKQKKKHGEAPKPDEAQEPVEPVRIEYEDISGEVDARLAEKEERRKLKEQRREEKKNKRKRDSEGSVGGAVAGEEKPKKKKKKVKPEEDETKMKKRGMDKAGEVETEGAAEKKRKKVKASGEIETKKRSSHEVLETEETSESKKKKQKRVKTEAA
ncbi:MAG: hypothetical protein L6R35_000710 [Caloplaca aegaea]|nr:MAG: hypothetical protein L6R35_000710 [Caloplaca aegaea]